MEAVKKNGNGQWIVEGKHPYVKLGIPIASVISFLIMFAGWLVAWGRNSQAYDDTAGKVPVLEEKVVNLDVRVTGIEHDLKPLEKIPEQLQRVESNQRQVLTDLEWLKKNVNK
ncbi:hypothetical protein [Neomegalonema sp.]|uniref:hypothetical protein n=1 Tax=Neomegalonema sp. TaxID=2039713 RepID=UPI00262A3AFB|nr:hypothetical protein [Neomegalonema sp.]MDD2869691.1 hypothetical protein [Neomegalonema sp.]